MTPIQYLRDWIDNREAVDDDERARIYGARKIIDTAMRERFGGKVDQVIILGIGRQGYGGR